MDELKKYVSNTVISNGNQFAFTNGDPEEKHTGLLFIKVYKGGTFPYVFAYSSVLDSTFGDGKSSHCNEVCPKWILHSLQVAPVSTCEPEEAEKADFRQVLFSGKETAVIENERLLFSDPTELTTEKGQYICLKTVFSGERIPHHEESLIPKFVSQNGRWTASVRVPVPVFTGVKRKVNKRVAFIGDSITQGLGTEFNACRYYAAYLADMLGEENAYWNLGIGYARGSDAATRGVWLTKAAANDVVTVCFGVNDILQGHSAEEVINDIGEIVTFLKERGCTVILQTVPPFDYDAQHAGVWRKVNEALAERFSDRVDELFDTVPVLSADGDSPVSRYGSHPNGQGHLVWAQNLAPVIRKYI